MEDEVPAGAGSADVRSLDRAGLMLLVARIAPDLLPPQQRPQPPAAERVSAILDRVTDHWQTSWHAVLEILPICEEGDAMRDRGDLASAAAHFTAIRDTIAAQLSALRDVHGDLAGLIVDCDRDIAACSARPDGGAS